jgi:hypothetical protein
MIESAAGNAQRQLQNMGLAWFIAILSLGIAIGFYAVYYLISPRIDTILENQKAIYQLIKNQQQTPIKPRKRNP